MFNNEVNFSYQIIPWISSWFYFIVCVDFCFVTVYIFTSTHLFTIAHTHSPHKTNLTLKVWMVKTSNQTDVGHWNFNYANTMQKWDKTKVSQDFLFNWSECFIHCVLVCVCTAQAVRSPIMPQRGFLCL